MLRAAKSRGTTIGSLCGGFAEADLAAEGVDAVDALSELSLPKAHSVELEAIRTRIAAAARPLFVFEERTLPRQAIMELCGLAAAHPNGRLFPVRALSNLNGLLEVGLDPRQDHGPNQSGLAAAVIVGADPARDPSVANELTRLDLVVALAPRENKTTALAHVVLPFGVPFEGRGHVVDAAGRLCERDKTALPPAGQENWEILVTLAAALRADWSYTDWEALVLDADRIRAERPLEESVFLAESADSRAVEVEEALRKKGI